MPSNPTDLFGWMGFSFPTPLEFAPISLTGARREGYIRLGSSGKLNIQIRWRFANSKVKLSDALDEYLARLKRDSKKAKEQFKSEIDKSDEAITYRYTGVGQGRGKLFFSPQSKRLFFIEVVGGRKDQLLPTFRMVDAGFQDMPDNGPEIWSVLGLKFKSPIPLVIDRKQLLSGRVQLKMRGKALRIEANRWAFGKQLIDKHGFADWSCAALEMKRLPDVVEENQLEYKPKGLIVPNLAIVRYDEQHNQIITLKAWTRKADRRPTWDWLDF